MTVILILLSLIVGVGALLYVHHRLTYTPDDDPATEPEPSGQTQCCGLHEVCEKGLPRAGEIIYYDDEELDAYAGREPASYTDAETEQFRDVLLTLLPQDVAGWAQSLQLRGITPPEAIAQELMLMLTELCDSPASPDTAG